MPPKRKQPASTSTTAAQASKPRRSKLAKEHDLTNEELTEIHEAYTLFCTPEDAKNSRIATTEIRRALIALKAPPKDRAELNEIVETLDPESTGWVEYEHFVAVAAMKIHQVRRGGKGKGRADGDGGEEEGVHEEVQRAYKLFTKGEEREITIQDLRRVARELREEVSESVLKDMLREATGGRLGPVGIDDFQNVMKRAGVFG